MSWADVLAAGEGQWDLRLEIEGWPIQFCTGGLAAGTQADGRRRVNGMLREGIVIEDRARMAEGNSDRSGFSVRLVDLETEATQSFTGEPYGVSWLVGSFSSTDTRITVQSTAPFLAGDTIHIGTEAMLITNVHSATELDVTRAQWTTAAQRHTSVAGAGAAFPEVTTSPLTMAGRRCYLYAHTAEESSVTSSGTLIFRGVLNAEPRLSSATEWDLEVDGLLSLLDQDMAAKLEDLQLRGVYYPQSGCLRLDWLQSATTSRDDVALGVRGRIHFTGFYVDNQAFATQLNSEIATEMAARGQSGSLVCRFNGNDDWWLEYTPDALAPKYLTVHARSPVDGATDFLTMYDPDSGREVLTATAGTAVVAEWIPGSAQQILIDNGFADAETVPEDISPRAVPRACYGAFYSIVPGAAAAAPNNVIYLARAFDLNANDSLAITARRSEREDEESGTYSTVDYQATVQAITTATGAVELRDVFAGSAKPLPAVAFTRSWGPKINATAVYGFEPTDLSGFRDHLVSFSPEANPGTMPLITSTDFEDISAVVTASANGRHYLTQRVYHFDKPVKLREFLAHECMMLGCYLTTTATGAITVKQIQAAAPTDAAQKVIGTDDRVVSDGFGSVEISPDQVVNRVELLTGYNPTKGKHEGPRFVVRDVRSISRLRREHTLEIKPKSRSQLAITTDDAIEDVPGPLFGVSSDRYLIATVDATWRLYEAACGDTVSVDAPQLPYAGARGLNQTGIVVGRRWSMTEAQGTLDILLMDQGFVGYAPSARVSSAAGAGVNWTLNTTATQYAPSGITDASYFLVGYGVQLVEWNTSAPTIRDGTITGVSGSTIDVTLTAAWTGPGAATYSLIFDDYAAATADQIRYAYTADATALLGGSARAKVFAP